MRHQFRDLLGAITMRRSFFVLSLAFLLPSIGQAQHSGATPALSMHISVTPAQIAAPHMVASVHPSVSARPVPQPGHVSARLPAAPRTVHPSTWNTGMRRRTQNVDHRFNNGNRNFASDCFPTPGLGFDFPHFFATHPNFASNCRFGSGFVVPFIDGGFYLPTPFNSDQTAPQPAEEAAAEQPASSDEPADRVANFALSVRTQPAPAQQEYVFVKRDGTLIFAVGYSWINDRLQYVTAEGIRRTAPLNTLDLGATQQFNDQRGVPIQPPA